MVAPHATINVLRADQLAVAEGRRTTGNLYTVNIRKLVGDLQSIPFLAKGHSQVK